MSGMTEEKQTAVNWIVVSEERLSDFHQEIWHYAEPAFREYRSAKAYCELLRREGFEVTEGTGGMPTAFMAVFGEGKPVIGSYAEYDAVPENSQEAAPYKAPGRVSAPGLQVIRIPIRPLASGRWLEFWRPRRPSRSTT